MKHSREWLSVRRRASFWRRVQKTDSCWLWTGGKAAHGYGQCAGDDGPTRAHRYSWVIHFGAIPEGLCVLHRCDNPPCVNPEHLWLGTGIDNSRDMVAKGRGARVLGVVVMPPSAFGRSLLRMRLSRHMAREELARRSEVHKNTILHIEVHGNDPRLETVERLAKGLGVPLEELLNDYEREAERTVCAKAGPAGVAILEDALGGGRR